MKDLKLDCTVQDQIEGDTKHVFEQDGRDEAAEDQDVHGSAG